MNRLSPKRRLLYAAFLLFPFASPDSASTYRTSGGRAEQAVRRKRRRGFRVPPESFLSGNMVPLHRGQRIPERNYRRPGSDRGGRLFLEYNCSTDSSAAFGPARNRRSPASVRCGTMPSGIPQRSASGWDCALRCKDVPVGPWRAARGSNPKMQCAILHGAGRTPRPGPAT